MEIGRWTAFRLILKTDQQPEMAKHIQQLLMAFEDFNVAIDDTDLRVTYKTDEGTWMHADYLTSYTNSSALALLGSTVPRIEFEVRYQLEVCISRGLLNEYSITPEFLAKLAALEPMKARLQLEYLADQNKPLVDPLTLLDDPEAKYYFPGNTTPHYCALVRKVNVTPTTMRLNTPVVETSNRILRAFSNVQDRFLRVQFVDEKESDRICRTNDKNYEEVWNRILRTFYQGIQIGDRHYEFLAYGSSQLRQCGAYFFAPIGDYTCDSIRQWMGSFDHIRVVAKYAARVGQCFSTTRPVRGSCNPTIHAIEDTERNGYCFTDGVGIISSFLSTIVIGEMGLDVVDTPSAFQFRMGGYKGVLAVWPQAKGVEVHARKSQQKFMALHNNLEIIRCAKYATATLNQQTIGILESLGVPTPTFVKLLDQQIKAHKDAITDDKVAISLLTKFVDENQNTLILAELLKAGFRSEAVQEPFVVNLMKLWHAWSLKLLKEKSRIHVEKSAFVLGCVDETGTLRGHSQETEGSKDKDIDKLPQISLRITDPNRYDKTIVITGLCIVGRNPSLHPGDIRVVQAVDNPKLEHLKDVVVFPSTGDRPIPNMLSGGDLDGDDFFIIWDQSLIPAEWNHPPMDYTGSKPMELDRDVIVDDIRNFFLKYMKQDTLGLIATAHKGQSDKHGPKSSICKC
jgi:RNA-dependent RNA polymerase